MAGPRHRLGVRRPRAHARRVLNFILFYVGGVHRNNWLKGDLYSNKRKEGPKYCRTSAHQMFHPFFFFLQPSNISFSYPQPNAVIFTPQHFISQFVKLTSKIQISEATCKTQNIYSFP